MLTHQILVICAQNWMHFAQPSVRANIAHLLTTMDLLVCSEILAANPLGFPPSPAFACFSVLLWMHAVNLSYMHNGMCMGTIKGAQACMHAPYIMHQAGGQAGKHRLYQFGLASLSRSRIDPCASRCSSRAVSHWRKASSTFACMAMAGGLQQA